MGQGGTSSGSQPVTGSGVTAASLLGNVGSTTVGKLASSSVYTQATLNAGEDIYGP